MSDSPSENQKIPSAAHEEGTVRDPVCGMWVAPDDHAITYLDMHFAFCSTQCQERFLANPHLYIGRSGHKAPAQQGHVSLKSRRLKLAEPLPEALAERTRRAIEDLMGIDRIEIDGDTIDMRYDLVQVSEAQIEAALAAVGATLDNRWSERLRRAFVQYLEETEISSLEVPPGGGGHHH